MYENRLICTSRTLSVDSIKLVWWVYVYVCVCACIVCFPFFISTNLFITSFYVQFKPHFFHFILKLQLQLHSCHLFSFGFWLNVLMITYFFLLKRGWKRNELMFIYWILVYYFLWLVLDHNSSVRMETLWGWKFFQMDYYIKMQLNCGKFQMFLLENFSMSVQCCYISSQVWVIN